ncbi:prolactin receptor-like [Periophthalmus magnuspinnatus]|uniref:prolactin receptor-like n=1 Tax=Periophthalmus magnuspinnatus TaxID=409849 RepID=UPI00243690BB|nr:prolactin receptor-like [Periophthalmus magnuspinnatus]XP_055082491.1 prolactin receptor-like [Periophthalmus magnuspinnatus]
MLWVLVLIMSPVHASRTVTWDETKRQARFNDDVSASARPLIYYCRSRNMEDFSCYWHPLDNVSDTEGMHYVLTYKKDKGPVLECPDYVSSGPHSCHFDRFHTNIWKFYCMTVTAVTSVGNYTSPQRCLDVADIVEMEAPVNLTYDLYDAGGDETGHNTLLSWAYPQPSDLQYGWITLIHELQYRRVNEPTNWKVKGPLREPHVELLGLPVGEYVVQVRCRSHNYGRWSQWSLPLYMSIPARPPTGKLLVLVLVTGVSVVFLIGFILGLIQQSKRIKDYFLPPIPKPRIIGIDPLLLKKGNLEEINRHFSSFHGYSPPSYSYADDIWDQVSADDSFLTSPPPTENNTNHQIGTNNFQDPHEREKDALIIPSTVSPTNLGSYVTNPTQGFSSILPTVQPDFVLAVPGSEYSVMGQPSVPEIVQTLDKNQVQSNSVPDFYTCVQLMHDTGEVHLVPCLPPSYCDAFPNWDEKMKQKEEFEARKFQDGGEKNNKEENQEVKPVSNVQ